MFGTLFRFVGGALLGAAVGGAIGMLVAPKNGEDLQKDLRAYWANVKESGRQAEAQRRAELEAKLLRSKGPKQTPFPY